MERKLKIGIIGTGNIAGHHVKYYKGFDDVEVTAGADIVPGKARQFFERMGLPNAHSYENVEEMLRNEQLDGVSVCTYHRAHAPCSIAALEAGVHVLCEKPMSFTLQEAVDMVKASRKSGKFLTIGYQPRYDYLRQRVDEIISSGQLGKIYYIESGGGRRRGIPSKDRDSYINSEKAGYGVIGDNGCYSVDECLHAVKYPRPLTVSAAASSHFGKRKQHCHYPDIFDVEDFATALVRLEGDITFVVKTAWAMHSDTMGNTMWLGTEGGIKIISGFSHANLPSSVMYFTDVNGQHTDSFILPNVNQLAHEKIGPADIWTAKMRNFCDAVRKGGPAPIPGEEVLYNQAILDGMYRSAKLNREVEIVIPDL
ncbi:MAG TPA: oxidoreductase [Clostridiales bacterium]|nr:oxidoreductase [Clostridiales bacterium]